MELRGHGGALSEDLATRSKAIAEGLEGGLLCGCKKWGLGFRVEDNGSVVGLPGLTWRFRGGYKSAYQSLSMGYKYSYPA